MKCSICGSELEPGWEVCKYCGNKIEWPQLKDDSSEVSENTEKTNGDVRVFCSKCGSKLDEITQKCPVCSLGITESTDINDSNDKQTARNTGSSGRYHSEYRNMYSRGVDNVMARSGGSGRNTGSKNTKNTRNTKKAKKKNPALVITLAVAGMMALFAVTFLIFFNLLGGSFSPEEEETQTPQVTASIVPTQTPQATRTPSPTPKPEQTRTPKKTKEPEKTAQPTKQPTQKPESTHRNDAPVTDGKYAYPSDSRVITESELEGMSRQEIKIVLNEIYARHGYTFNDDDLVEYFESKTWYIPTISDMSEAERKFNDFEMENKNIIVEYQKEQGWRQ